MLREMLENRKYIRHEVRVPIEVKTLASAAGAARDGVDVSHGGLAFLVDEPLHKDHIVWLRMPTVNPPFEAKARVAWCRPEGVRFRVGVAFLDAHDAFQSRMVEQVCAIEAYRMEAMKKGRRLTTTEAAAEWVKKYADKFPT